MTKNIMKKTRAVFHSKGWWAEHVEKCASSGLTMVAYAQANGLALNNFYKWKSVLSQKKTMCAIQKVTKVKPVEFLEVMVESRKTDGIVEIESPTGWRVRMSIEVGAVSAAAFVSAIEGRP